MPGSETVPKTLFTTAPQIEFPGMAMLAFTWADLGFGTLHGLIWVVTCLLLIGGLVGTIVPMLPGPVLIFIGAIFHYCALRWLAQVPDPGIGWIGMGILLLFVVVAQVFETASSAMGAKYFGSTKWGTIGALVGGIVGIFFGIPGIFLGPVVGALAGELIFARRHWKPAAKSTWGTFVGTAAGLVFKAGLGVLMVGYFFLDVWWLKW